MIVAGTTVEHVARALFPHEHHQDGFNCGAETGNEGEPCGVCASQDRQWRERLAEVREALETAPY